MEMVERNMPHLGHDDILGQRATGGAAGLRGDPLGPAHQGRQYKGQPKHMFSGHHDIPFLIKVIEDGVATPHVTWTPLPPNGSRFRAALAYLNHTPQWPARV